MFRNPHPGLLSTGPLPYFYLPFRDHILDVGPNALPDTFGNPPVINTGFSTPIGPGAARVLDPQGLRYASSSVMDLGTGNWFWAGWFRMDFTTPIYPTLHNRGGDGSPGHPYNLLIVRVGLSQWLLHGSPWFPVDLESAASSVPIDTWFHTYLQRSGNTLSLYLNGSVVATQDITGQNWSTSQDLEVASGMNGYVRDFVWVKGSVLTAPQLAQLQTRPYSELTA